MADRAPGQDDHAPLAVYDLDGVVTHKDSFTALLVERLRASPLRLLQALPAVASWAVSGSGRIRRGCGRTPSSASAGNTATGCGS